MRYLPFYLFFSFTFLFLSAQGQKVQGYEIYNSKGKKVSFENMVKELSGSDLVFFGELHNDPISHWLQFELVNALGKQKKLILGAEMFESDNQEGLSQYVKGIITEDSLKKAVRLWNNYATDYAKLVRYAKDNQLEFVATNIPRKYARMVFQKGFSVLDTLPQSVKKWIAPLPVDYDPEVACYRNMLNMDMGGHAPDENFPKAQAIKDATMAHFIISNFMKGSLFIHFNGSYHSDNHEGILWYTKRKAPQLVQKTISTVLQKDVNKLAKENIGVADFIICVNENMTTTY